MSEEALEELVRESRKTGRLLNLAIVISIASLGLSIFTLI
jgi:hypothetical protein